VTDRQSNGSLCEEMRAHAGYSASVAA
jgi:hypothetical protein